jgi:thioredoxin 1
MSFFRKKTIFPQINNDGTIELDESCFDEFVAKNSKVVVMFYRSTCSHSVKMNPIFIDLCTEMKEGMKFCKVSTPTNMELVNRYEIKGTPTFVIVNNGKKIISIVGERTKEFLKAEIERVSSQ